MKSTQRLAIFLPMFCGIAFPQSSTIYPGSGSSAAFGTITGQPTDNANLATYLTFSVNVKAYGAKGDGSTDDSSAINSAGAAVVAAGGGRIVFPAGTYISGSTINISDTVPQMWEGASDGSTVIKQKNSANLAALFSTSNFGTYTGTQSSVGSFKAVIKHLTIDGNRTNNTSGIGLRLYGSRCTIDSVTIQNSPGDGLYTEWYGDKSSPANDTPMESTVTNTRLLNNGGNGWTFKGPHDTEASILVIANNGGWGLATSQSTVSGPFYIGAEVHLSQAQIWGNLSGGIDAGTACHFNQLGVMGVGELLRIESTAGAVQMSNSIIGGDTLSGSNTGIHVLNSADIFTNIYLRNTNVAYQIDGAFRTVCDSCVFYNNNTHVVFTSDSGANIIRGISISVVGSISSGTPAVSTKLDVLNPAAEASSLTQTPGFSIDNLPTSTATPGIARTCWTPSSSTGAGCAIGFYASSSAPNSTTYSAKIQAVRSNSPGSGGTHIDFYNHNGSAAALSASILESGAFQTLPVLFSALPTCTSSTEGAQKAVTDSSTATYGATITGGSSNHVLAYCNGTNWTVH